MSELFLLAVVYTFGSIWGLKRHRTTLGQVLVIPVLGTALAIGTLVVVAFLIDR